jgi:hypothetical protein
MVMKKLMFPLIAVLSFSAFAEDIEFNNLTKKQVEDVTTEFAVNFAHTTVAAPETNGLWGIEVGVIGGTTGSPKLKDAINDAGGSGSDFKTLYHAGLMARAHFPLDLFAEVSVLPEREISSVTVASRSAGIGWNAGAFFGLPLDIALGANASSGEIDFEQDISGVPAKINIQSQTRVLYVGVSKTLLFATPYVKVGTASQNSDIEVKGTGTIFGYTLKQKDDATKTGGYLAAGLNLQLAFFKIGAEFQQMLGVKRVSGKISLDF